MAGELDAYVEAELNARNLQLALKDCLQRLKRASQLVDDDGWTRFEIDASTLELLMRGGDGKPLTIPTASEVSDAIRAYRKAIDHREIVVNSLTKDQISALKISPQSK